MRVVAKQTINNLSAELLTAVNKIQREFILNNPRAAFENLLESLLSLTDSEYGFVGEVLREEENKPYLITYAISNIAWNDETRKFYEEYRESGMEFHNLETLFGKVLSTGKHMIANEPATHPDRGGLPKGHPPLNSFIGVPLYVGERFTGMAGLANRPNGYDDALIDEIRPLLEAGAYMIEASRERRQRQNIQIDYETSRNLRDATIETALDCVIAIDHESKILEFNPAAEATFGWSRSEVLGGKLSEIIIPEELREAHDKGMERYLATGVGPVLGHRIEIEGIRANGERFPIELAITVTNPHSNPVFTAYLRDITERKEVEATISAAREAAEVASQAKSAFVSTISHEIRTPLSAITGALGLLEADKLDSDSRTYLRTAQASADALIGLVDDVLDFSRIEAERMTLELSPVNIISLLDGVIQVLSTKAGESNTEIGYVAHAGVPQKITADLGKTRQVLLNIAGNALKFSQGGEVLIDVWPDDSGIRFEVSDSGVGISDKDMELLFEEFVQVGDARLRGGAGLGLVISKRLLELMGGHIYARSKLGHGSTFYFNLPCKESSSSESSNDTFSGKSVMIIDSNTFYGKVLKDQLTAWSVEVILVANISEALSRLKQQDSVDVVILVNYSFATDNWLAGLKDLCNGSTEPAVPVILMERAGAASDRSLEQVGLALLRVSLPLQQEELLRALNIVFSDFHEVDETQQIQPIITSQLSEGIRILLAEDSQANRLVVAETLRRGGFYVDVAADGLEATEAIKNRPYHVVLMDIDMPEMDGVQATRAIRQAECGDERVPIIALTAHADATAKQRFVAAGMNDYISKPVDRQLLFDKILIWAGRLDARTEALTTKTSASRIEASTRRSALLDAEALALLAEDTSAEIAPRLISVFIKELRTRAGRIEESSQHLDFSCLASEAHALKSSAATYGAAIVRDHALRLDSACTSTDRDAAAAAARDLIAAVEPTAAALTKYIEQDSSSEQ